MHDLPAVPPSPAQRLLAWVDEVDPGVVFGPRFVCLGGYRLGGPLDLPALRDALNRLLVRHEALRTLIVRDHEPPYLRVEPPAPVPLVEVAPDRLIDTIVAGTYPSDSVPLLWAYLARHNATDATLVLVAQQTVVDPWSMRLLIADLLHAYADRLGGLNQDPMGAPPSRERIPAPRCGDDELRTRRLIEHWRRVLTDVRPLPLGVALPGGAPRTTETRFSLAVADSRLRAVARTLRTTPFVLLLSGFIGALSALTGATDLTVPVLTYGRGRSDWDTVGLFMNALPVRVDLTGDLGSVESLRRVHAAFAAAFTRELPLADLVSSLPEAARFFAPGGPVNAQFEVIQVPPAPPSGPLSCRPIRLPAGLPLGGPVIPVNGLAVWLEQDGESGYTGTVRFRADLFSPHIIDQLVKCYADRLDWLVRP
ncbi:condensation domain-containing protein [Micromonospora sp. NPDC048999]|uniref:condensation domain-containing protein n=1 Tax=Micromonospora sp. NPDC048999 TaxID=3155391 RepID=UPI0033EBE1AF